MGTPRRVSARTEVLHSARVAILADLEWDPADPLAVTIWFTAPRGEFVDWKLSRELLATGLVMSAGEMDVRVEPFVEDLLLTVGKHDRERVVFVFRGSVVSRFLADTYRQIPLGAEQITVPDPGFFTDSMRLPEWGGFDA